MKRWVVRALWRFSYDQQENHRTCRILVILRSCWSAATLWTRELCSKFIEQMFQFVWDGLSYIRVAKYDFVRSVWPTDSKAATYVDQHWTSRPTLRKRWSYYGLVCAWKTYLASFAMEAHALNTLVSREDIRQCQASALSTKFASSRSACRERALGNRFA